MPREVCKAKSVLMVSMEVRYLRNVRVCVREADARSQTRCFVS